MPRSVGKLVAILGLPALLSGCLAGAAVNVVGETVEAGVEVTGAVVGTTVDVIVPDGDDDEGKDEDDE
jgi:hypothetical protein